MPKLPGLEYVLIVSIPMFLASVLSYFFLRRRWLRILIVSLLGIAGRVLLAAAAFGVAMGSGHGSSHRGPSAKELSDTFMTAWPVAFILALIIAWRQRWPIPVYSPLDAPPTPAPRFKTLREVEQDLPKKGQTEDKAPPQ